MNASTLPNVITPASELLSFMQTMGSKEKMASAQAAHAPAAIKNRALPGLAGPLLDRLKLGAKDLETVALAGSIVGGYRKISSCA